MALVRVNLQTFFDTQTIFHESLKKWGFPTVEFVKSVSSAEQAWEQICELDQLRHGYTYPTDGAVIKLDSRDGQRVAGHTSKAPRWAIAYKFESERQVTILNDIVFQGWENGCNYPVACLEPVQLAGTLVSRQVFIMLMKLKEKTFVLEIMLLLKKLGKLFRKSLKLLPKKEVLNFPSFNFPMSVQLAKLY